MGEGDLVICESGRNNLLMQEGWRFYAAGLLGDLNFSRALTDLACESLNGRVADIELCSLSSATGIGFGNNSIRMGGNNRLVLAESFKIIYAKPKRALLDDDGSVGFLVFRQENGTAYHMEYKPFPSAF